MPGADVTFGVGAWHDDPDLPVTDEAVLALRFVTSGAVLTEEKKVGLGEPSLLPQHQGEYDVADEYVRMEQFGEFVRRMDERFDHVNELADQRFDSMNQRFLDVDKRMEQGFAHIDQRFEQVEQHFEQRFEQVDRRFEQVDRRLDRVDKRFDDVQAEIRSLRKTMLALGVPVVVTVVGAILSALVKFLFFNG